MTTFRSELVVQKSLPQAVRMPSASKYSASSRQLRLRKRAGLVSEQARGTRRIYALHDQGVEAVQAYVERVWGEAASRFRLVARNTAGRSRDA